jgi:hypothetical protein
MNKLRGLIFEAANPDVDFDEIDLYFTYRLIAFLCSNLIVESRRQQRYTA